MLAVRGASFLPGSDGLPIVAAAAGQDIDRYLDYVIKETMRQVDPGWKKIVGQMQWLDDVNTRSRAFVLDRLSPSELVQLPMNEDNASYLLSRPGIDDAMRTSAVTALSTEREITPARVLVSVLSDIESKTNDKSVIFDLIRLLATQPAAEMVLERDRLAGFAENASLPALRQIGLIGMMLADQNVNAAWEFASKQANRSIDLCNALPLIPDPELQTVLYPKILPLVDQVPDFLVAELDKDRTGGKARFVRIELPGPDRILTLAEVEVIDDGENIARAGTATQSSDSHGGTASRAIDGNTDGQYARGGQTHTTETTADPWWELNLAETSGIQAIRVFNRTDESLGQRLDGFTVRVLDENRNTLFVQTELAAPAKSIQIDVDIANLGQTLRRAAMNAVSQVRGKESDVFAVLVRQIVAGNETDTAVRAIQRLPVQVWKPDVAAPLAATIVQRIEQTPEALRSSAVIADWMQLGEMVAGVLGPEEASKLRGQLGQLGIRVIRLGVKPHRMAFDKTKLVVPAGKPIVVIFENTDMMPHNLVLTQPGSMEAIGTQAELEAQRPDALSQHYVPKNDKVIVASRLVQPQQSQRINFTTPTQPGVYPFVCTYPGHWRRMFGALMVVASPEEYLADPAGYSARNGLEFRDPLLLTINRATTEWKVGDLSASIGSEFQTGRDFANGQQMFTIGSCVSCHKFAGKGHELGPDLTQMDVKWTAEDILNHLIEPSTKIDEKYKTQIFQLISGNTVSGVVVSEDDRVVRIVENPLVQANTTTIAKADIDERVASNVSIMPKGLLDSLSKDEIFDLIGYVISAGNESHSLYGGKK